MIESAWNEYRGWARRARQLPRDSQRWTRGAMALAVVATILGAAASEQIGAGRIGPALSFLAAACAAIVPVLGQDILSVGREFEWIRARATSESIKGECFRFAARSGDYVGPAAAELFRARRDKAIEAATKIGLIPLVDLAKDDARRPSEGFDAKWYLSQRLDEQRRYYADRQLQNEREARNVRYLALAASILAALLGAASASLNWAFLSPWIGVLVTLGAMVVAHGLMERRQFLAASYGAMAGALGRIAERFDEEPDAKNLLALVGATEDLLAREHGVWIERMVKTTPSPLALEKSPQTAHG
jgi:hypothetical protein